MQYIKGYLVLYVVLMILIQMIPREGFRKYIRFFSEMILVIGILTPMLQFFGKEDFFLEKINYEAFMEELEEVSSEAEEIVFTENQEYLEWCEKTIEVKEEE